jgi:transposase
MDVILGIDVSKLKFHVNLMRDERNKSHAFANVEEGFKALETWLDKQRVARAHACMESTGGYGEALATFLHNRGHIVSVVNPSRIKSFAGSELLRTKTDKVDAALIARFCAAQSPDPWVPPTARERLLQSLVRRREDLGRARVQESNRLERPGLPSEVRPSIDKHVAFLDSEIASIEQQIHDLIDDDPDLRARVELLTSIPGIGERTAATLLGEMPRLTTFRDAKAVAAYAGLSPRHHESGMIFGRTKLSKIGNARLRKSLFFPAMTAMRVNQPLATFAERLRHRGKPGKVIVAAVMRRLLVLAYGVLKSGVPFTTTAHAA